MKGELKYEEVRAINYSLLSALASSSKGAKAYLEGKKEDKAYFGFGTLVDMLLTEQDKIDDTFMIVNNLTISDGWKKVADEYFKIIKDQPARPYMDEDILEARKSAQFQANWKDKTIIDGFHENCEDYIANLIKATDSQKIIIYDQDFQLATTLSMEAGIILNDFITTLTKQYQETPVIEYQKEIYWDYDDIPTECKGKLDILLTFKRAKTFYIIDIKTFAESFITNYYKFKYYYQGSFYFMGVIGNYIQETHDKDWEGYVYFLAIDKEENPEFRTKPCLYKMSDKHIVQAFSGTPTEIITDDLGYHLPSFIKGWGELIDEYKKRMQLNNWEDPMEVIVNGYIVI